MVRVHDQLHAGVVDDVLAVGDLGKSLGTSRAQRRKSPSDIFMMLALWMAWIFCRLNLRAYSKANCAMRVEAFSVMILSSPPRRARLLLEANILAFGVLAHDDQIDARIAGIDAGQILDRPEVGEELELLAQATLMM